MLGLIFVLVAIFSITKALMEIRVSRKDPMKAFPPSKNLISFLFNLD